MPKLAAAAETGSSPASLQTVAQNYPTKTPLQQGVIVQPDPANKASVIPATYKDSSKMFGVVVALNDAAVSISTSNNEQSAYVVTSGKYKTLVSTQNGGIKQGDYVSISAANGIGMKADTKQDAVLGRAVDSFDGKTGVLSSTKLKQSDKSELNVSIGMIVVDISVGPNNAKTVGNDGVPSPIQSLAVAVVGKPISAAQLYISAAILIIGLGVVVSLLYGGIQTAMTSIGRNPLARKSIMRSLIQVIITGVIIFIGCLLAVYLVLRL